MVKVIKNILLFPVSFLAKMSAKITMFFYRCQYFVEWGIGEGPINFDHKIDLYYLWHKTREPHWLERGIFSVLAIKQYDNPVLLELCSGDGFNTKYFYSSSCEKVIAVDYDAKIVKKSQHENNCNNIEYIVGNILDRNLFLEIKKREEITNVVGDAFFEYFTQKELDGIIYNIKNILDGRGTFSGTTPKLSGKFECKENVKVFLEKYFDYVIVLETKYSTRTNFYYFASDKELHIFE